MDLKLLKIAGIKVERVREQAGVNTLCQSQPVSWPDLKKEGRFKVQRRKIDSMQMTLCCSNHVWGHKRLGVILCVLVTAEWGFFLINHVTIQQKESLPSNLRSQRELSSE